MLPLHDAPPPHAFSPPTPPPASNNHNEDGHEVLRLTGGGGDDAPFIDSDDSDDFHLQLPTPLVVVDAPSTSPPLAAEEEEEEHDSDGVAAAADEGGSDDEEMQIFVNGLQKKLCLQVLSSDTLSTIEALVQNKEFVSRSKFYLRFGDKKLEDGSRTIADLEIPNKATLEMSMGLRGGGKRDTIDDLLFMMCSSMFS